MHIRLRGEEAPAHDAGAAEHGRMTGKARRQQIIGVAMRLFSQKGFTGTTTKEIALAAGVNEALIFRHFPTKEDLYAAILDTKASEVCAADWIEELREYAERRDDAGLFSAIARKKFAHSRTDENNTFLRLMFYSSLEGHGLKHVFLERHARPIHDFLCGYVEERQREGAFRKLHAKAAISGFIGMLNHHIIMNAFFETWKIQLSDEEAITQYTNIFLNGLRHTPAPPGTHTSAVKATRSTTKSKK